MYADNDERHGRQGGHARGYRRSDQRDFKRLTAACSTGRTITSWWPPPRRRSRRRRDVSRCGPDGTSGAPLVVPGQAPGSRPAELIASRHVGDAWHRGHCDHPFTLGNPNPLLECVLCRVTTSLYLSSVLRVLPCQCPRDFHLAAFITPVTCANPAGWIMIACAAPWASGPAGASWPGHAGGARLVGLPVHVANERSAGSFSSIDLDGEIAVRLQTARVPAEPRENSRAAFRVAKKV